MDSLRTFRLVAASLIYAAASTSSYATDTPIEKAKAIPEPMILALIGGSLVAIGLLMRYRGRKLQQQAEAEKKAQLKQQVAADGER